MPRPALQRADGIDAHAGALGQILLREAGIQTVLLEQRSKLLGRGWVHEGLPPSRSPGKTPRLVSGQTIRSP